MGYSCERLEVSPAAAAAKSLQSCPTLWDPMDCSPPGSSVHGILQARILEWVAMPSSRGSSRARGRAWVSCGSCRRILYQLSHKGSPGGSDSKASAYNAGDLGSIPVSGRSPREGNGNPLQYSCLENLTDGGAW